MKSLIGILAIYLAFCTGCLSTYCERVNEMPTVNNQEQAPQGYCRAHQSKQVNDQQIARGKAIPEPIDSTFRLP